MNAETKLSVARAAAADASRVESGADDAELARARSLLLVKGILVTALAVWMTEVVINNITDSGTNLHLLGQMVRMDGIKGDPDMGNGLEWRAIDWPLAPRLLLGGVVAWQLATVALLWRGAVRLFGARSGGGGRAQTDGAIAAANAGLAAILTMGVTFMCGGMWFGYWMKMGAVQQVHMTVVMIALLGALVVNTRTAR